MDHENPFEGFIDDIVLIAETASGKTKALWGNGEGITQDIPFDASLKILPFLTPFEVMRDPGNHHFYEGISRIAISPKSIKCIVCNYVQTQPLEAKPRQEDAERRDLPGHFRLRTVQEMPDQVRLKASFNDTLRLFPNLCAFTAIDWSLEEGVDKLKQWAAVAIPYEHVGMVKKAPALFTKENSIIEMSEAVAIKRQEGTRWMLREGYYDVMRAILATEAECQRRNINPNLSHTEFMRLHKLDSTPA